jgi:hypothetical protein
MKTFTFEPATKAGSKARIALCGPPGSGKTWTALTIARAFGDNVFLVDTERGSARKYADVFAFRHLTFDTFDPADLTRAVLAAGDQGADVLIVDTWSPFWGGTGGMLDQVGRRNTSFEGWKDLRPVERTMIDALCGAPFHVVVNLRVKVDYIVQPNSKGKMEPKRVGLKPEQRDGVEYEFDIVADLDDAGQSCRISKTRCPELADASFSRPTEELGYTVMGWLTRDSVGEPLNPRTVRDWMLEPDRTPAELDAKAAELRDAGQLTAVIEAPNGELVNLGDALQLRRNAILRAVQKQRAVAAA